MTLRYAHHALESTTPAMRALDELFLENTECYKSVTFGESGETLMAQKLVPKTGIEPVRGLNPTGF